MDNHFLAFQDVRIQKMQSTPWGSWMLLDQGTRTRDYKWLVVQGGQCLSLQRHFHHEEHWLPTKPMRALVGKELHELVLHHLIPNKTFSVPKGHYHTLINVTNEPILVAECRIGELCSEEKELDIERVYDEHQRNGLPRYPILLRQEMFQILESPMDSNHVGND